MKPERIQNRIQVRYTGDLPELMIVLRDRRTKATFSSKNREKALPADDAMDVLARPDFERVAEEPPAEQESPPRESPPKKETSAKKTGKKGN